MCHTLSGIAHRNGDVTTSEYTDSHRILLDSLGIADAGSPLESRQWVSVEFLPPKDLATIEDMATWRLTVDEQATEPPWWDEMRGQIRASMERVVERMFVRDERKLLLGGAWILLPGSRVHQAVGGRVRIVTKGANLSDADLRSADLRSANLRGANLSGANLSGANLSDANLRSADLYGANLSGANLSDADLRDANLYGANLRGANLSGANLSDANLRGANLYGANLYGADLRDANLYGANLLSTDPVPAGWVRDPDRGLLPRAKDTDTKGTT
jgi:hypothetical protein